MNIERMQLAITTLEQVHHLAQPFDMSEWFEDYAEPNNCNTAACAFGWIARQPWAQQQGLCVLPESDSSGIAYPSLPGEGEPDPFYDYDAAAAFFDITSYQAEWLFARASYRPVFVPGQSRPVDAMEVAERMRDLVAELRIRNLVAELHVDQSL